MIHGWIGLVSSLRQRPEVLDQPNKSGDSICTLEHLKNDS